MATDEPINYIVVTGKSTIASDLFLNGITNNEVLIVADESGLLSRRCGLTDRYHSDVMSRVISDLKKKKKPNSYQSKNPFIYENTESWRKRK